MSDYAAYLSMLKRDDNDYGIQVWDLFSTKLPVSLARLHIRFLLAGYVPTVRFRDPLGNLRSYLLAPCAQRLKTF